MEASDALAKNVSSPSRGRRLVLPLVLLLITCLSTFWAGATNWNPTAYFGHVGRACSVFVQDVKIGMFSQAMIDARAELQLPWRNGLIYMAAVMGILLTHEMGHFLAALCRRVPASLPFFIPLPVFPVGTLGAVIGIDGSKADRRQIFDVGIAGPLAGLMVALPVAWLGLRQLEFDGSNLGEGMPIPLAFRLLHACFHSGQTLPATLPLGQFGPLLMAGWVGMLVTGLNMMPVSQLDGGHVAYGLLGRRACVLARGVLVAAIVAILIWEKYLWVVMVTLVILLGIDHPPTTDDAARLNWPRRLLGCAALAIPVLCLPV
jgi:membrane-associated protease RseP (regulator of RpoE activity)